MQVPALFHSIFRQIEGISFAVRYWDGTRKTYGDSEPEFGIDFKNEEECQRILSNPALAFGEAYVSGGVDIDGSFDRMFAGILNADLSALPLGLTEKFKIGWLALRQRNSIKRARSNIAAHYDVGNEFYSLWLGREMAYSCAYFKRDDDGIDLAQEQKFAHICAKLQLRPGERLLDVGCGWGGFLIHAAKRHGITGTGITLSAEQHAEAKSRIADAGLSDRLSVHYMDYRELPADWSFDKLASIGMFEHVGRDNYERYMRETTRVLEPGGLGFLQTIGSHAGRPNPWIARYIFPGIYLPPLAEIEAPMARLRLHVTDVEVLRRHYALTLDRWADALEKHVDVLEQERGAEFVRAWRFYLRSCAAAFRYGKLTLFQLLYTKGIRNDLPLTRDHLYRSDESMERAKERVSSANPSLFPS